MAWAGGKTAGPTLYNSSVYRVRPLGRYAIRVRTTIDLPEPLLKDAKRCAAERGVTLTAIVADALRTYLILRRVSAPPFRLHTVGGRLAQPTLDLDRTS